MPYSFSEALENIRLHSQSEFEKGEYFEKLVKVFLENDNLQGQTYDRVWTFKDWATECGLPANDTGIDLVAQHSDGSGFCAIQCKFYAKNSSISKKHIDSFVSAASTKDFVSLVIVDTTLRDFSPNLTKMLDQLDKDWHRIALNDLEKSRIDWSTYFRNETVRLKEPKTLRTHQEEALEAVRNGLSDADRGKLIMACGTGKTFTALKIAEQLAGKGKLVLYMVPSLALMSQTVREWKNDCEEDFLAFSVCSDVKVGKRQRDADVIQFTVHDLAFPATTDSGKIAQQVKECNREKMVVVFSTYQSIQVLTEAQKTHGLPAFDWIICDEAHRTTGATLKGSEESKFVQIHSNDNVMGRKRLYMTATPKIFGENAKSKAKKHDVAIASMDDEEMFGEELFYRSFSWAVENDLLSDYKVIVLAMDEGLIGASLQSRLAEDNEMRLDDATKIIGCYKALTKQKLTADETEKSRPMKRALAFCKNIAVSKMVTSEMPEVVEEYYSHHHPDGSKTPSLEIQTRHVDGTFNAKQREDCLDWLKAETNDETCRILTNARCLSEGVDVPALDGIIFMHPRRSQIDVVQSVGRVMRKAPGKEMGYVILPVTIPAGVKPEDALNDNERYQVVWQILNALRAHDERLDGTINQISLGEDVSERIQILGVSEELTATTAVVDDIDLNKGKKPVGIDVGGSIGGEEDVTIATPEPTGIQGAFVFDELTQAIRAMIVEKCGTREYCDNWAKDIAKIADQHIKRIGSIIKKEGKERDAFQAFLEEIRDDLNPEITEGDAIEMLAQHLITKPVFDTLFKDSEFTRHNPVSKAMEVVLEQLQHHRIDKEAQSLQKFYASVKRRAKGIKSAHGRQTLIVELYDKFFRNAFPKLTQRLGIVYTPVEVVDFIIHSVNDVLKAEFGQTLGSKGVHILDPFTGTGTFITRLLQSGLIAPEELAHKYREEIHANEIVLLAYYIAAINIETVYHELSNGELEKSRSYEPFKGILLTDTFQMYEQERDMVANLLPDNSERRTKQKALDIRVIIGNPPYSAGQKSANDNAANIEYPQLDASIRATYAENSRSSNLQNLYDSYIRAFRWASERIGDAGIMSFVSGSAWIERSFADGMRKCLSEEFSDLYIFHLRGDIRKNMLSKGAAREGQNVFGSGSMTGISIAVLVKNPEAQEHGRIHFHDIGPDLTTTHKLNIIRDFGSVDGISKSDGWSTIKPDENNDWLDQVDRSFDAFIEIGNKKNSEKVTIFENYSLGIASSRDAWVYNSSREKLRNNLENSIDFFNAERDRIANEKSSDIKRLVNFDPKLISWNDSLLKDLEAGRIARWEDGFLMDSMPRPFQKQWFYFSKMFNQRRYQMPRLFPSPQSKNRFIQIAGVGARSGFSVLMSNRVTTLDTIEKGQCFPLYLYDEPQPDDGLFAASGDQVGGLTRRDAITDEGLAHFQAAYPGEEISKEDLFYYIYGLLHSPDYHERFKNNLAKQLPRIPAVKTFTDFAAFRDAGRALGDLHVKFESVEPYPVVIKEGDLRLANIDNAISFYRVEKMKFGGKGKEKDKSVVHYNPNITMTGIPLEAYDYVVNGKPALEWVMERQRVKQDRKSGIVNDANDYANETVGNAAYPLELFQRIITVSLETQKIVSNLPTLDIDGDVDAVDEESFDETRTIKGLKNGIEQFWGKNQKTGYALKIVDELARNDCPEGDRIGFSDVLEISGLTEMSDDLASALLILTQTSFAILKPIGKFVDALGQTYKLSGKQFQNVLDGGDFLHPTNKHKVDQAAEKISVSFEVSTDLFAEPQS